MTFEEVAVYFSPAEWAELAPWQRELHQEVMCDNYDLVASLGEGTGPRSCGCHRGWGCREAGDTAEG